MVFLSGSGTGADIYAKLANGMARYNSARASPTRNSSVLRSLARRQPARYRQVTHRQGSGRMTRHPETIHPVDAIKSSSRIGPASRIGLVAPPYRSVRARLRIRLLPRMSGIEACIRIGRQSAGLRNPPVQDG